MFIRIIFSSGKVAQRQPFGKQLLAVLSVFLFVILVSSRFSLEVGIRVLIATVSGHRLLVTFSISKLNIKGDYCINTGAACY